MLAAELVELGSGVAICISLQGTITRMTLAAAKTHPVGINYPQDPQITLCLRGQRKEDIGRISNSDAKTLSPASLQFRDNISRKRGDESRDTNDDVFVADLSVCERLVMLFVAVIVPVIYNPSGEGGGAAGNDAGNAAGCECDCEMPDFVW